MLSPKIKQARRARSKSMVLGELTRLSRPCSPQEQEKPLKAGWLKRQRSIMKNWQLRWFVLRTEALYFYKDQDESKAQGCILLQGSQVNEMPPNPDEPGRHLFEIIPGGPGEKDRTGTGHESFLLMANSQSDMEEWVRAIRRAIWAPNGGGVFGQHLEETMSNEAKCGHQRSVPVLVEQCVTFIREHGLKEEGLFRAPGQTNHVRELQDAFDRGEKPVFDSSTDVHTVASLLKLYIRELPEPIIPFSKYTQFLSCSQFLTKDKEMGILELRKQVKSLPQVNYNLLKYICKFLDEVPLHSNDNKMTVQNLATVFGPNILRPRVEDPVTMMEGSSQVQQLMTVLISEHTQLYPNEERQIITKGSRHQEDVRRSKVEWVSKVESNPSNFTTKDSATLKDTSMSCNISTDTNSTTSSSHTIPEKNDTCRKMDKDKSKVDEKMDMKVDEKPQSDKDVSPSKQSKALPSWKGSLKVTATSGGPKGKIGGSAGDVSGAAGSNWLMNGLSSLRVHRRTSSVERGKDSVKDSTQSLKDTSILVKDSRRDPDIEPSPTSPVHRVSQKPHRLSAYDNVAPSSLSLPADALSVWTPFEISLSETQRKDKENPPEMSEKINILDNNVSSHEEDVHRTSEDALIQLKQELKNQKISCETSIQKLEETCSKYQLVVKRLEEELDQEKKKSHMLEIRLRNSERAHQDAENRNILLQKEMEEFFKTLGDLTTGAARTN